MNYALLAVARQSRSKRAPSPLTIPQPLRREKLLRYAQFYLALSRRKFKFDIFRVQVSATQICKFDFKFGRKKAKAKYREMILNVLK